MIIEILDIGYQYETMKLKIRRIDIASGGDNDSIYHVIGYSIPINLYLTEGHIPDLIRKAESLKMNIIQIIPLSPLLNTASGFRVRYMLHDSILLPMHIQNKNNAEYVEGHEEEGVKELLKLTQI